MFKFLDDLKLYALKVLISLSRFIPDFILYLIFKTTAKIWFLIDNNRKLAVKNNLEIIIGYSNNRLIYETFENYMLNFVDLLKSKHRSCQNILSNLKIENFEILEKTYRIRNKLILLSAHIGSWEIALNFISCLGYKSMAIVENIDKKWLDTLNDLRGSKGTKLVLSNQIREIINFLNNEGILCVVSDRYIGGSYLYCQIFNRKRKIPIGIFKLNEKFKIPLIFAYVIRQKDYHLGIIQDFYYEEQLTLESMLSFYLKNLEIAIKKYPTYWFSFDFNWL